MKKPRQLTPEELAIWRENNHDTTTLQRPTTKTKASAEPLAAPPKQAAKPSTHAPASNKSSKVSTPKRGNTPLPQLSSREAMKRFKQHPEIDATLDLHGLTKLEAYTQVQRFITRQHRAGHRHVTIITGKGRGAEMGVLRSNLPDWLNEPPLRTLISTVTHARPEKGGTGVTHVLLKRV
jgi:DNA-nicking Smr family endonuclease